ncbi:MAG: MarR family transcriptional regulator [Pseudomonadota bacterium]
MKFPEVLENIHRTVNRQWARDGARIGLSHSEFEYLRAIHERETEKVCCENQGHNLQDVVATMGIKKASASAMIVKLEKRGLVERLQCRADARAQHLILTQKGVQYLQRGEQVYEAAAAMLRSEFSRGLADQSNLTSVQTAEP